jgi:hypothetical protein
MLITTPNHLFTSVEDWAKNSTIINLKTKWLVVNGGVEIVSARWRVIFKPRQPHNHRANGKMRMCIAALA